MITEILEEDFRRLNLHAYKGTTKVSLNDILTKNIEYWIENGYESDLKDLQYPVTIALHINYDKPSIDNCYWDKFMNSYTGPQTYQLGMGIPHLYSTRDYYEAHDDYWRVHKNETKVVYRIRLNSEWQNKFVLKHKTVISKVIEPNKHYIEDNYDLIDDKWELKSRTEVIKNEHNTVYKPL